MGILVRELPPLRLHYDLETPSGRHYRWAADEPNPANVPSNGSDSSTMPGGYEQLDVTLARKPGVDYSDLDRLSTIRALGPGGDSAWEGRLERTPRVSGDQMAISPSAVGWQAHLDDDKSATLIVIDRDLGQWHGMSRARIVLNANAMTPYTDGSVTADDGAPGIQLTVSGHIVGVNGGGSEIWYDAGAGNQVAQLLYSVGNLQSAGGGSWGLASYVCPDDAALTYTLLHDSTSALATAYGRFTSSLASRFALFLLAYGAVYTGDENERYVFVKNLAVVGNHGLTLQQGGADLDGFLASDIVTYAVQRWAPLLTIDDTVQASSFVIQQAAYRDPTTAGEIVRQATSYGLQDWAVWDDRTFYWAQRGTYGRKWRARIAPAQLSETGPQLDRLWESVIVSYNDVDGTTRTVGPVGSGADTEDAVLHDSDPENPANQLGIIRRDMLSMGTSTAAGAIELGRRFLEEQKLLDTSGQAQLVGHVMDDHGVLHPYWRVRAGDTISFVDASDTSERRIVRASNDHGSRTCTVDLDAPPEGLDALLARLGAVLVPLGLS